MIAYYLITCNEDGETSVQQVNPNELARQIVEGDLGDATFVSQLPPVSYTEDWRAGTYVLIKGEIVVPQAVKVVTQVVIP